MKTNIFAVAWRSRTYLRILYLLLAFPLGLFYFVFLVTLIATGVATALIAGIGIGLLLLALACWFGFAGLERILAIHWLGVRVPPRSVPVNGHLKVPTYGQVKVPTRRSLLLALTSS